MLKQLYMSIFSLIAVVEVKIVVVKYVYNNNIFFIDVTR